MDFILHICFEKAYAFSIYVITFSLIFKKILKSEKAHSLSRWATLILGDSRNLRIEESKPETQFI